MAISQVLANEALALPLIKNIAAADKTAADNAANTDETLSVALTDDEATLEQTLATAGATYQIDVGAANQNYRQAVAQADDTLTVETWNDDPDAESDYSDAMAAADEAKTAAIDAAYADFATAVQPAITLQGTDDANAEDADTETNTATNLTDIEANNAAVDTYDDAESGDYSTEQTADATALDAMQVANANGHAAAIASFDQSNPSPWADMANWQAAAQATQQIAQAAATLTRSVSEAQSQQTDEEAQSDATTAKDDSQAEAEETQTDSDAETADAEAVAQSEATDTVFTYLPDTLIAPTDGPTPTLAPDYFGGYEANDYDLAPTMGAFLQVYSEWSIGYEPFDLSAPSSGGTGYTPGEPPKVNLNSTSGDLMVSGSMYGIWPGFGPHDMDRNLLPQTLDYAPAMHFTGSNAELLDLVNTPSNIGPGGYTQSPLPTTAAASMLSTGGTATSDSMAPPDSMSPALAGKVGDGASTDDSEESANLIDRGDDQSERDPSDAQLADGGAEANATEAASGADTEQPVRATGNGKTVVVEFLGHKFSGEVVNRQNGQKVQFSIDDGSDGLSQLNANIDAIVAQNVVGANASDEAKAEAANRVKETLVPFTGGVGVGGTFNKDGTLNAGGTLNDVENYISTTFAKEIQGLSPGDTVRVVIVGYSHGAENAINAVERISDVLRKKKLIPEVHLVLIDAVKPGPPDPNNGGQRLGDQAYISIPDKAREQARTVLNYYQTKGDAFFNLQGRALHDTLNRLQQDNKRVTSDLDRISRGKIPDGAFDVPVPHSRMDNVLASNETELNDIDRRKLGLQVPKGQTLTLSWLIAHWETKGFK